MSTIPPELNWVQKRASCSAEQVFRELQAGIENDIAAANQVRRLAPDMRFDSRLTDNGRVFVVAQMGVTGPRVVFFIHSGSIEARDEANQTRHVVSLMLNDEGRCKLKLEDGRELEQWQFRKLALEGLFFGDQMEG